MQKVSLYIRHSGSRKYEKANPKTLQTYQGRLLPGATFVLRYVRDGKRVFETLKDCPDLKTAHEHRLTRELRSLRVGLSRRRERRKGIYLEMRLRKRCPLRTFRNTEYHFLGLEQTCFLAFAACISKVTGRPLWRDNCQYAKDNQPQRVG
jgi:hypothetical protein